MKSEKEKLLEHHIQLMAIILAHVKCFKLFGTNRQRFKLNKCRQAKMPQN